MAKFKVTNLLSPRYYFSRTRYYLTTRTGLVTLSKVAAGFFVWGLLVAAWYAKDLPTPDKIKGKTIVASSQVYDRTGKNLLYSFSGEKNLELVEFSKISQNVKDATLAVEDRNFYKHGPLAFRSFFRALIFNVLNRDTGNVQGGSTITQQYVKNALLSPERTITRKAKELILSTEIEILYSKDDILNLYLNTIPYGSNIYGVQSASKSFFGKDAKDLDVAESATIAAMTVAPSYYSPYGLHQDKLVERKNLVIDLMLEQGYITKDEADEAKKKDVLANLNPRNAYGDIEAPHFVLWLREVLAGKYGERLVNEGGLKIISTLDMELQEAAQAAVNKNIKAVRGAGGSNVAMTAQDPKTGQVLAMLGSADFFSDQIDGQVNVAISDRQPGSSIKPLVYSTLLKQNYGAGTTLYDVKTDFGGGYSPSNYDVRTHGVQSIRTALANSYNIPAVKAQYMAGTKNVINTAHEMGITTLNDPDRYGLSLTLGGGEVKLVDMVQAFSVLANEGFKADQTPILKITDQKGSVIEEYKEKKGKRVLDPQIAYIMSDILSDDNARGPVFGRGGPLTLPGRKVAAKTGTTERYRDAWTMGYTPQLVSGFWAGNNDGTFMRNSAVSISAPIWQDFMASAMRVKNYPAAWYQKPAGVKSVTLDAVTGKVATNATKERRTDLFPSWYRPKTAGGNREAKIDKVSRKLATNCTPPEAVETVNSADVTAEIPPTDPAYSRWNGPVVALARSMGYSGASIPIESDDAHSCSDAKPSVSLSVNGNNPYSLKAAVSEGKFPIATVQIFFDDTLISELAGNGSGSYNYTHSPSATGNHTYRVKVIDRGYYTAEDTDNLNIEAAKGPDIKSFTCSNIPAPPKCTAKVDGAVSVKLYEDNVFKADMNETATGTWTHSPYTPPPGKDISITAASSNGKTSTKEL